MKPEYDFSKGRRGAVVPQKNKTRITLYIDNDVLEEFRSRADATGQGYQTIINQELRKYLDKSKPYITESILRRVLPEELRVVKQIAVG